MSDQLGDSFKAIEAVTETTLPPGWPTVARLDGRAFHTFTRGLDRPFDHRIVALMRDTATHLVEKFHAAAAYVQSDEISLVWPRTPELFGYRVQKLVSVLAGAASARFCSGLAEHLPCRVGAYPHFDCRVFQLADVGVVDSYLAWREADAVRNSVQAVAQSLFSARELHGRGVSELLKMIPTRGRSWHDYPDELRRGSYLVRTVVEIPIPEADRLRIPERHRPEPGALVTRTRVLDTDRHGVVERITEA